MLHTQTPPLLNGKPRDLYDLWEEFKYPFIAIEFARGDGEEERDTNPLPLLKNVTIINKLTIKVTQKYLFVNKNCVIRYKIRIQ